MYCAKCGMQNAENSRYCAGCGHPINVELKKTVETYEGPLGNPTPVLVWGILGLSFAVTLWFSILGLIFSIIGLKKEKEFREFTGGADSKQATIGKNLAKAGLIVSIVLMAVFTIMIIISLIAAYNY